MQLIWNQFGNELEKLTRAATASADVVWAAIAYATDPHTLLDACWNTKTPLRLYARYDHSGPVSDTVLSWFFTKRTESANYEMFLVPDIFHPKVIWWQGVGVYIGSANLSQSAWVRNIESGIYLTHEELIDNSLLEELESFFEQVQSNATPLTREIAEQLKKARDNHGKAEWPNEQEFNRTRIIPRLDSIVSITRRPAVEQRKTDFINEWNQTLEYLREIGSRLLLPENRPEWLPPRAARGVLADQFLHAYFLNIVKDGNAHPFAEMHDKNRNSKELALSSALKWWAGLRSPPGNSAIHISQWAPFVQAKLRAENLRTTSEEEFVELCKRIHSLSEHARQVNPETLGLERKTAPMNRDECTERFARWLFNQKTRRKQSCLDVIHHVLYGGTKAETPNRLFNACYDPQWKIPHLGISALGEMVGWAMPDDFPPRNGRTSKALTALGYDVTIHSV
jgi:hypothetical protein